jgi:hypothetical protein
MLPIRNETNDPTNEMPNIDVYFCILSPPVNKHYYDMHKGGKRHRQPPTKKSLLHHRRSDSFYRPRNDFNIHTCFSKL